MRIANVKGRMRDWWPSDLLLLMTRRCMPSSVQMRALHLDSSGYKLIYVLIVTSYCLFSEERPKCSESMAASLLANQVLNTECYIID